MALGLGLLGNLGSSALNGLEGLFGMGGAPQPAPAAAPAMPQPSDQGALWNTLTNHGRWIPPQAPAPAAAAVAAPPQQPQEGLFAKAGHLLFGGGQGDPGDPLGRFRPGLVQEALGTVMAGGNPWLARDVLTSRNYNQQVLLPMQMAIQRQRIGYGMSIPDPAMREMFFNNPAAYYALEQARLGQTKVGKDETVYGAGPNGDQTLHGSVTLNPGQDLTDTAGGLIRHAPAAPIPMAASTSLANGDTGQIMATAPAAPQVVTRNPNQKLDVVTPGAPGAPGTPSAAAPGSAPQPALGAGGAGAPRGIRNNNPLNLTTLGNGTWDGEVGTDGPFAVFSSPQAGLAAADKNLLAKQTRHGLNTLQGVIAAPKVGWDPGNTAYVNFVAKDLGVRPDQSLNLLDPQVRRAMLGSMQKFELGRGGPPSAQAQASGTPADAGGATIQNLAPGSQPRQLSPQEAMQRNLGPGTWFENPDGTVKNASPAPKEDLERVNSLLKTASMYDELQNYDQQFIESAKELQARGKMPSGWKYDEKAFGIIPNPVAGYYEQTSPQVARMHDIHSHEMFLQKPDNLGQKILASELPFWQTAAVDPGKTIDANMGLIRQHREEGAQAKAKALFYKDWLDQHGNLNGADAAWLSRSQGQASGAPPQRPAGPPMKASSQGGWKILSVQ